MNYLMNLSLVESLIRLTFLIHMLALLGAGLPKMDCQYGIEVVLKRA